MGSKYIIRGRHSSSRCLRRHELFADAISSTARRDDTTDEHNDDREGNENPNYPGETFERVQLTAVYKCVLCAAVQASTELSRDGSCACRPEHPSKEQKYPVGRDASQSTRRGCPKKHREDSREEEGPDWREQKEARGVTFWFIVRVVFVEVGDEPCRDWELDYTEEDDKTEDDRVSPSDMIFKGHNKSDIVVVRSSK